MNIFCIGPHELYERMAGVGIDSFDILKWRERLSNKTKKEVLSQGDVVVLNVEDTLSPILELSILELKSKNIPIVVLTKNDNIDLALACGALGVDKIINSKASDTLLNIIREASLENTCKVTMKDLGIVIANYPADLRKALTILEKKYTILMGISEIAQVINRSQSSVSQLFKKNHLATPKKILMYLKVVHALNLLKRDRGLLKLKEVSYRSGFSSEKRFIECFKRTLDDVPGEVKEKINIEYLNAFFKRMHVHEEISTVATA